MQNTLMIVTWRYYASDHELKSSNSLHSPSRKSSEPLLIRTGVHQIFVCIFLQSINCTYIKFKGKHSTCPGQAKLFSKIKCSAWPSRILNLFIKILMLKINTITSLKRWTRNTNCTCGVCLYDLRLSLPSKYIITGCDVAERTRSAWMIKGIYYLFSLSWSSKSRKIFGQL